MNKITKAIAGICAGVIIPLTFTGCAGNAGTDNDAVTTEATGSETQSTGQDDRNEPTVANEPTKAGLTLSINGEEIDVEWEDNESVAALSELVGAEPLNVAMSMYADFEQVGSLGKDLPRSDEQTTTEAGDIVLYQGNRIVVFYGSNSWAYTRIGHIEGKTAAELEKLLGVHGVTLTLEMK